MSEASRSSFRGAKVRTFLESNPQVPGNDQLGNPFPVLHLEGSCPVVDEQHAHLAAVIGIDRARRC
jgi:hypothetical protein